MFARILCPIDFTLFSHHAVEYGVALARRYETPITALHVAGATLDWSPEDLQQLKAQALRCLHEAGATSADALVAIGNPADEIVRAALHLSAGLIVMPSHGRTGYEHVMCGSVTADVLRHAPCPILTVPREAPVPAHREDPLFRRIACAIDFSPSSLKALQSAAALAGEMRARLTVVHVIDSTVSTARHEVVAAGRHEQAGQAAHADMAATTREMWQRRLHEAVTRDVCACEVVETMRVGAPAAEILRVAEEERSDLLVIGGHRGLPLGSTMNQVLRQSKCGVLTVRASA